ncbi:MAG: ABC transporter permease [Anaerolineae bacterium]
MQRYIANRLVAMLITLIGVTIIVFLMIRLIPGTIVELMLGTEALTSYESIESLRRYFGLDLPVYVQYYEWFSRLVVGDLGTSWRAGIPVLRFIMSRLPVTLELTVIAIIVALLIGVPAGVVSALARNSWLDNSARIIALAGLSFPLPWQGTLVVLVLSLTIGWSPSISWVSPFEDLLANLKIMLVPGICLGTVSAAVIMRMTRSSMLDVLSQDYVRTARAKGLKEWRVIVGHALKNGLIPVVTVAGLQMGWLLGGSVVIEEIFTLPGLGRLVLWAIYQRDYPTVQGTVLFIAFMFMILNVLVDIFYAFIDPRIRYD